MRGSSVSDLILVRAERLDVGSLLGFGAEAAL